MKIPRLLRKLAGLSTSEWRDLFAAQWALVIAQLAVWFRPRGSLVTPALPGERKESPGPVDPALEALARAVDRAASCGPIRAKCLVRSIALAGLVEKRGYTGAVVCVGVQRKVDRLLAHAWVEVNGTVIGHDKYVAHKFEPLPGIDVGKV